MRAPFRWWLGFLAAGVLLLALTGRFLAGEPDQEKGNQAPDSKQIRSTIRAVIKTGARLHNARDYAGSYRFFQGGATALRSTLAGHPKLQKALDSSLAEAERNPSMTQRCWILYRSLSNLYGELGPKEDRQEKKTEKGEKQGTDKKGKETKKKKKGKKDKRKDSQKKDKDKSEDQQGKDQSKDQPADKSGKEKKTKDKDKAADKADEDKKTKDKPSDKSGKDKKEEDKDVPKDLLKDVKKADKPDKEKKSKDNE